MLGFIIQELFFVLLTVPAACLFIHQDLSTIQHINQIALLHVNNDYIINNKAVLTWINFYKKSEI